MSELTFRQVHPSEKLRDEAVALCRCFCVT